VVKECREQESGKRSVFLSKDEIEGVGEGTNRKKI